MMPFPVAVTVRLLLPAGVAVLDGFPTGDDPPVLPPDALFELVPEPPQPSIAIPTRTAIAKIILAEVFAGSVRADCMAAIAAKASSAIITPNSSGIFGHPPGHGCPGVALGTFKLVLAAVVVTIALMEIGLGTPLATCAVLGETMHVAPWGAPVHESVTVPVNPADGASCRLYAAVCPAVTLADVDPPGADEMVSGGGLALPVPLRLTSSGDPDSLVLTSSVAVRSPIACGAKVTLMVQLPFTGSVITPQLFTN